MSTSPESEVHHREPVGYTKLIDVKHYRRMNPSRSINKGVFSMVRLVQRARARTTYVGVVLIPCYTVAACFRYFSHEACSIPKKIVEGHFPFHRRTQLSTSTHAHHASPTQQTVTNVNKRDPNI
ncbi:unnamed protein product [Pylaiella littoralis]